MGSQYDQDQIYPKPDKVKKRKSKSVASPRHPQAGLNEANDDQLRSILEGIISTNQRRKYFDLLQKPDGKGNHTDRKLIQEEDTMSEQAAAEEKRKRKKKKAKNWSISNY